MIVAQDLGVALPLSPLGRGREAMTYGCAARPCHARTLDGAAVSHLAELVRGNFGDGDEGPLIRPFGPPSPVALKARLRHDGEKGRLRLSQENP